MKTETLETKVRGVGKLLSEQEEALFFTEDGRHVQSLYFKSGDNVKAGDVIAELDMESEQNQLAMARLNFRSEELNMKKTLRDAGSMDPLELEQLKISFEKKRQDLVELEQKIAKAKLIAPFSGTIVSLDIKKGDTSRAYTPIAIVADTNQLAVAAKISKDDLKKVAVGMSARVEINGLGQFDGKVKRMPRSDQDNQNGNYDPWGNPKPNNDDNIDLYVIVDIGSLPKDASRGTPLSAAVVVNRTENAITIPPAALRSYAGRTYVQVVDENGNKSEVDVEVGQQTSTSVEIISGLKPGQKVVGR